MDTKRKGPGGGLPLAGRGTGKYSRHPHYSISHTISQHNRFLKAHQNRVISDAQLRVYIAASRDTRQACRDDLGIHQPVLRLDRRQAWRLVGCILEKLGGTS